MRFRTALKIAARDLKGSLERAAFITITMAISVASIAGIRGAAGVAR